MPDQNGIMTPQEVADLGINALLKVRALKQQDEQMRQQSLIFKQQLESGALEHKSKQLDFEFKESIKRILGQKEIDPTTGQPKTKLLPHDLQLLQMLGVGPGAQPMDYLPDEAKPAAAGTSLGLIPDANTTAQVGAQTRGQDIQKQAGKNAMLETWVSAGANPWILSQGDPEDPKTIAKAFDGVEPTARLQAYANVLQAKAAFLHATNANEITRVSTALQTQEEKNKVGRLKVFNDALGKQLGVAAQLQNSGAGDAEKAANARAIAIAASAVSQEMVAQGFSIPPEVAPDKTWFESFREALLSPRSSTSGGIDINKLVGPDGKINLDMELPGASPAPGAASPSSAAPPTQPNQPAATAPNSSAGVDANGFDIGTRSTGPGGAAFDAEGFPYAREPIPGAEPAGANAPAGLPLTTPPPAAKSPSINVTPEDLDNLLKRIDKGFGFSFKPEIALGKVMLEAVGLSKAELAQIDNVSDLKRALTAMSNYMRQKSKTSTGR